MIPLLGVFRILFIVVFGRFSYLCFGLFVFLYLRKLPSETLDLKLFAFSQLV